MSPNDLIIVQMVTARASFRNELVLDFLTEKFFIFNDSSVATAMHYKTDYFVILKTKAYPM